MAASKKSAKDNKVFDVAKPGKGTASIGSKPMIVGHKSVANDPMMKDDAEATSTDKKIEDAKPIPLPSESKLKISPISEDMKAEDSDAKDKKADGIFTDEVNNDDVDEKPSSKDESDSKDTPKQTNKKSSPSEGAVDTDDVESADKDTDKKADEKKDKADDTKEEGDVQKDDTEKTDETVESGGDDEKKKELDPAAVAMERDDDLRKIIDSKKYRLDIKESSASPTSGSSRKNIVAALAAVLIGLIGLFIAVDTNMLDLGIKLPFRIFGEEQTVTQAPATAIVPQENEVTTAPEVPEEIVEDESSSDVSIVHAPVPDGYTLFDGSAYGFSFSYPSDFGVPEETEGVSDRVSFSFSTNSDYVFTVNKKGRVGPSGHDSPTLNLQSFSFGDGVYQLQYLDPDSTETVSRDVSVLSSGAENQYIVFEGVGIAYFLAAIANTSTNDAYDSVVFNYIDSTNDQQSPYTAADEPAIALDMMLATLRTAQ